MSATDRSASASTYARRRTAAASFYSLNPGVKKSLYSGAGGQENSVKAAGLRTIQCPCLVFYTVVYNGNGNTSGSVPVDPSSPYKAGSTVTVLGAGGISRSGYLFTGWNTAANGSGFSFAIGDTFTAMRNIVLYAQWTPSYTVTYIGNGNTGGTAPVDPSSYSPGSSVTVLGPGSLIRMGFLFTGWNTVADGSGTPYAAGSILTIALSSVILYAQWTPSYTVTYNGYLSDGGTVPVDPSSPYATGSTVTVLDNTGGLYRFNTEFAGWNTNQLYTGTMYVAGNTFVITSDITLYSEWYAT
jgi:uncharacterized repeat protein (TIGR02543 family)